MVASRLNYRFIGPHRLACLGLICLQIIGLGGCKKSEEIKTYTVAHRDPPKLIIMRMLGAIIPNAKEAWFFKVTGADEDISKFVPEFIAFTKTVSIKKGQVTWKAPDAWKERSGGEFRFTTFVIPRGNDKPLELAVSRLDAPEGVDDKYLVANLSRWRGQLALGPVESGDIPKIPKIGFDGGEAWFVNYAGLPAPSSSMGPPPFANGPPAGHPPIDTVPEESAPATAAGDPNFEFETPKGWAPGKTSSMRKAAFEVTDGEATAEITVITLSNQKVLENINRWRDQVGLKEISADELAKTSQKIDVGGHKGDYVELVGEKDTILGVMVKKGDTDWFYKLKGPTALAAREKARFEQFVKSSRLP